MTASKTVAADFSHPYRYDYERMAQKQVCTAAKLSCRYFPGNAANMVLLVAEAKSRKADVLVVGDSLTVLTTGRCPVIFKKAWKDALATGRLSALQSQYAKVK